MKRQSGTSRAKPPARIKEPERLSPRKVISLFTGAGGLDLGFEAAGYATRVAVEIDEEAVRTLERNRPDWQVIDKNIHSEAASTKNILQKAHLAVGEADVLIGGPPCQPFSKSGYWANGDSKRLADPRADTIGAYLRVLRDTQPRVFLLENVPGISFDAKDEGIVFIRRSIEAINRAVGTSYSVNVALLRAVHYGVPQDRHRVFIIGARDGSDFTFPDARFAAPRNIGRSDEELDLFQLIEGSDLELFHTAWDAIADLEDDDDPALALTGKWADLLPSIPEGRNYLHHTARGRGRPLFGWRRRYWNFLLKLAKTLPSWTVAAQPGPATGPFHWKNRRLSARELMRLQTFPDGYQIVGDLRSAQRQIGNAVPSALAEVLALEIRRQLLGEPRVDSMRVTLLPKRRGIPRAAEPIRPVPKKYLGLIGDHDAHPGTGRGYAALRRAVGTR